MKIYKLDEAAELLKISVSYIRVKIRNKEIEAFKFGGKGSWRIKEDEINRLLNKEV